MGYFDGASDDALFNSPEEIANAVAGFQRLRNTPGTGVGSIFPPRTSAGTSIPLVAGLHVTSGSALNGSTVVTLRWLEPPDAANIATYNIYVKRTIDDNQAPQLVSSSRSPAQFTVQATSVNNVVFVVQTVMQNGQMSPIDLSPTCSIVTVDPTVLPNTQQFIISGLVLTNNSPTVGNVAWSSCTVTYNGVTYVIASGNTSAGDHWIWWQVGDTYFHDSGIFFQLPNNFLVATNTGGIADTVWNKSTAVLQAKGDLATFDTAIVRLPVGTNGQVLTADSTATPGIAWKTPAAAESIKVGGTLIGTRAFLNLIAGAGITLSAIDDGTNINVTISTSGVISAIRSNVWEPVAAEAW